MQETTVYGEIDSQGSTHDAYAQVRLREVLAALNGYANLPEVPVRNGVAVLHGAHEHVQDGV